MSRNSWNNTKPKPSPVTPLWRRRQAATPAPPHHLKPVGFQCELPCSSLHLSLPRSHLSHSLVLPSKLDNAVMGSNMCCFWLHSLNIHYAIPLTSCYKCSTLFVFSRVPPAACFKSSGMRRLCHCVQRPPGHRCSQLAAAMNVYSYCSVSSTTKSLSRQHMCRCCECRLFPPTAVPKKHMRCCVTYPTRPAVTA